MKTKINYLIWLTLLLTVFSFSAHSLEIGDEFRLIDSDGVASDEFGYSVSISGQIAIVGALYDDDRGDRSGSAYIFERKGVQWVQQAKPDPALIDVQMTEENDL